MNEFISEKTTLNTFRRKNDPAIVGVVLGVIGFDEDQQILIVYFFSERKLKFMSNDLFHENYELHPEQTIVCGFEVTMKLDSID